MKKRFRKILGPLIRLKKKKEIDFYEQLSEEKYPKYLAKYYKNATGQKLDWDNLQTYNEKMQWAKLYEKDPMKTTLSDKYKVREWVEDKIGNEYLIPLLGVWDNFIEINFSNLPNQFVLKTNHASGTNLIVENKNDLDMEEAKVFFDEALNKKQTFSFGFQLHYEGIEPKIIAEKLIQDSNGELNDYKFLCFDGKVYYCWVDVDRNTDHKRNVYDLNWNLQDWNQHTYPNTNKELPKPKNFDQMIEIAKKLCQGFSQVRVDLYNVDGQIYFGEMTFTNGSGFELIHPHSANLELGKLWKLPIDNK